jgi:hypothetical protein
MEDNHMRMILPGMAILTGVFVGGPARAEVVYPWCMVQADGRINCGFTSFEQCRAEAMGKSAFCNANPRFQGRSR